MRIIMVNSAKFYERFTEPYTILTKLFSWNSRQFWKIDDTYGSFTNEGRRFFLILFIFNQWKRCIFFLSFSSLMDRFYFIMLFNSNFHIILHIFLGFLLKKNTITALYWKSFGSNPRRLIESKIHWISSAERSHLSAAVWTVHSRVDSDQILACSGSR